MTSVELIEAIRAEYCSRRERNANYSLRSFAKQLEISPGALSEILQGKREIGLRTHRHLREKMGLLAEETSIRSDQLRTLSQDEYALVKDWYHYALQDLLRTKGCVREPQALAERLGITTVEAVTALHRMNRLGLVREAKGKWYAKSHLVTTTNDIPSDALRAAHRQDLRNVERSLDSDDVHSRDFSSITLCFAPSKMKEAQARIAEFRRKFWQEFDSPAGSEVYQVGIYLYPLTTNRKETLS